MIFPDYLKKNDFIGVTAPSDGNRKEIDFRRLELARKNLDERGYHVKVTPNVYTSERGRSSSKEDRAKQFMELITDNRVASIVSAKGGDFLMEVLPLIDFDSIRKNPKWIQGYSDNTGLLFSITTICDMATMYSNHFNDFAITPWHKSQKYNIELLEGKSVIQESFSYYEDGFHDRTKPEEGYQRDKPVSWKSLESIKIKGRMLGGCLDVLLNLVGTRFDFVGNFVEKYKKDGIVWYLESFSLDAESITRGLWQLREAGWFEHTKGFVFGRPCFFESYLGYTYEEAVEAVLGQIGKPIIYNADIGHKAPQFTVVNGAVMTWEYEKEKGRCTIEGSK